MAEKIMTLHPDPSKQGVNIDREKYDVMRRSILEVLETEGSMNFSELAAAVKRRLNGKFDGAIMWYFTTVKLDLEARGAILRAPNKKPQVIKAK